MNPSLTVVQLQARVYSKLPSTQITNDINKHASTVRTDQSCEFANLNDYNIQVQALGRPLVNSLHHPFFLVARAVSAICKGKRRLHPVHPCAEILCQLTLRLVDGPRGLLPPPPVVSLVELEFISIATNENASFVSGTEATGRLYHLMYTYY
ncbi:uncharacterized protein BO95DRAFT_436361 [Aspergillus brunneoviolaceus CBS 621.78]|uniref:Uncharacterized protein n=1 Tax=Aspergillus brunneoviolaceus CBS 621.78 TaxID=1450534 RepID=A0ACD1FUR2_9EURO|nr:hypothetical protein BO95DRAFT_436361 [Aspergillus brunneoviolaceus CBS 621.78]RAH40736.1 hypothetical protein BO95DRAFT_436361 [Aspergillus brunneoviolaceus CBS 621.78]